MELLRQEAVDLSHFRGGCNKLQDGTNSVVKAGVFLFLGRVRYEELTLPKLTCLLEVLDSRLEGTKPCSSPSPSCIRPLCLME